MKLQEFDLVIKYISGEKHRDVDCLSRAPVDLPYQVDEKCVFPSVNLIMPTDVDKWLEDCDSDQLLCRLREQFNQGVGNWKSVNGLIYTKDNRLCVPEVRRTQIIKLNHESNLVAHPGIEGTCDLISRKYYWPGMNKDVETFVKGCDSCLRRKTLKVSSQGLMNSVRSNKPSEAWALDFIGPRATTKC